MPGSTDAPARPYNGNPDLIRAGRTFTSRLHHRGPDDPSTIAAHRELKAARLEQAIRSAVDTAPPLTAGQLAHLASLLGA